MIDSKKFSYGSGKYLIEAMIACCGQDLNITFGGGEKYHIGAVAISIPRNDMKNGKKRTASTSVICVHAHREDEISYKIAKRIATELDCTVVITMGIHLDSIKQDDIQILVNNVNNLTDDIIKHFKDL